MIQNRAHTPEQKRKVIERLYKLWLDHPYMRLSQLTGNLNGDHYHTEDLTYMTILESHYTELDKRING